MNNIEKSSFKIYLTTYSLLVLLAFYILGYSFLNGVLLYGSMLIHNIFLIYRAYKKKNILLLIVFLFMFLYTYVLGNYFIYGSQLSIYSAFNSEFYIYKTACVHFLFLIILQGTIKVRSLEGKYLIKFRNNGLFFYISFFVAIFLLLTGKSGNFITFGEGYGVNEMSANSRTEYFLIPYFIAFLFSNNNKTKVYLLYVLCGFYIFINIMYGGRVEFVMVVICVIIFRFVNKLRIKQLVLYGLIFFYSLNILGNIRQDPYILKSNDWYNVIIPLKINTNNKSDVVINNESDVFYATNRMISMADDGIISTEDRLNSLKYFFLSIFVPSSFLPDIAVLSTYKKDFYPVGGGGLVSGYFYVFSSFIGVILIAFFISKILSEIGNRQYLLKDDFLSIYMLFILLTLPRWFAYSPITLFKLSFYGAILTYFFIFMDKSIYRK